MRLSPATRLRDRQTVWVGYRNDGTTFNTSSGDPTGHPAAIWAALLARVHSADVKVPAWKD